MCKYCEIRDETPEKGRFTNTVCDFEKIDWVPKENLLFYLSGDMCHSSGAIIGNVLRVYVAGEDSDIEDIPIKHCPMCGKKLQ